MSNELLIGRYEDPDTDPSGESLRGFASGRLPRQTTGKYVSLIGADGERDLFIDLNIEPSHSNICAKIFSVPSEELRRLLRTSPVGSVEGGEFVIDRTTVPPKITIKQHSHFLRALSLIASETTQNETEGLWSKRSPGYEVERE